MKNFNKEVFDVLRTDTVIKTELGGEFIYQFVKGNDKTDIWITFSELNISPGVYAENEEKTSNVMYQVDIWSMSPIKNKLKNAVQTAMKKLSFQRVSTFPDYEIDTKIYRYGFRFITEVVN
ncbi:structural protein [Bacillus thuringiensis serovar shandongiensis]|uniref:tail completion protein gp17 n=1 Tax=Bacillus toyonensis TaxID=155322 RepID=UPI000B438869|nr:structural protein [Bacillus toyonensis]MEC2390226.1 structural protein [Bacillus toyonensis]OTX32072.1 structural protein [Bacillus thuringiensis serovar malayensis]OUB10818.1 structural protein [Bacillus thuringiensis serovar shandongiensis]